MKKLEFTTEKGVFILEEASDKNLGRVLVKYMTEEQFDGVVDSITWRYTSGGSNTVYRNYLCNNEVSGSGVLESAKQSFESLIKSLGWYLFENPYKNFADEIGCDQAESKTLYNPVLLKKK